MIRRVTSISLRKLNDMKTTPTYTIKQEDLDNPIFAGKGFNVGDVVEITIKITKEGKISHEVQEPGSL